MDEIDQRVVGLVVDPVDHEFLPDERPGFLEDLLAALVEFDIAGHLHREMHLVHVLAVELDRRGKEFGIVSEGLQKMPGITRMVGAETPVAVTTHLRAGNERTVLADVVGPTHQKKATRLDVQATLVVTGDAFDHATQVVGVAADHL